MLPRYPVYVPTKGRFKTPLTIKFLKRDGVEFYAVVEPQEYEQYLRVVEDPKRLLVLPWSGNDATRAAYCAERRIENGGLIAARNWIREHSIALGAKRHWQLDDNMYCVRRWISQRRIPCNAGVALRVTEDFVDRYTNVGVAGLNYTMFSFVKTGHNAPASPFRLNAHVYSCSLIWNEMPHIWRLAYNDDTDLCLQVLAGGLCTVQMQCFTVDKVATLTLAGGNTADLYKGNGRLKMARSLERMWPGVVETKRRFRRAQHVIKYQWERFDTPLIRRADIDWDSLRAKGADDYGMKIVQVKPRIKSKAVRSLLGQTTSA